MPGSSPYDPILFYYLVLSESFQVLSDILKVTNESKTNKLWLEGLIIF